MNILPPHPPVSDQVLIPAQAQVPALELIQVHRQEVGWVGAQARKVAVEAVAAEHTHQADLVVEVEEVVEVEAEVIG
jgi:hypothetical protein